MDTFHTITEMREWSFKQKTDGFQVHFVPTMGYFHEGHLSLLRFAKADNAKVVASIFINPKQFGPNEDFLTYPRDLPRDIKLAETEGVDALFLPSAPDMYSRGFQTKVWVSSLSLPLCGEFRPGHFEGVALVVLKLFNIVQPTKAFFGSKDYQQLLVIKQMTADLNLPLEIVPCPTVREPDGLAMSSRNSKLSDDERKQASRLYQSLCRAKAMFQAGERDPVNIQKAIKDMISLSPLAKIQYAEVVDGNTLQKIDVVKDGDVAAVAVYFGSVRLIDNIIMEKAE